MWKSCFLFCLLFGISFQSFSQFQFRAPGDILHYRIDFGKSALFKENKQGIWMLVGNLTFDQVNKEEIPNNARLNAFKFQNSILVTIPGTGQVYLLDLPKMHFKRLDRTFYRGYNFNAIQYIRNDTLFSHGGEGFWHANNVTTYFSIEKKEWEMTSAPEETSPRWMKNDFGGYDAERKILSVIEFPALYDTKNQLKNYGYFEKSILNNQWKLLGDVNVDLLHKLGIARLESQFVHGKYFFLSGPMPVWADPKANKIYQIMSLNSVFNSYFELSYHQGKLYSYNRKNSPTNLEGVMKIDSISFEKLKSLSTYKGPFYIKPYPTDWIYYGSIALIISSGFAVLGYFKRKKKLISPISEFETLDGLPDGASHFLKSCLSYPQGHAFSSQIFTDMMGYSSYAYETQRQVRAKLIKGINNYFWAHYRMEEVIHRQTADDDKRFSVYMISEVHYVALKKLLCHETQ